MCRPSKTSSGKAAGSWSAGSGGLMRSRAGRTGRRRRRRTRPTCSAGRSASRSRATRSRPRATRQSTCSPDARKRTRMDAAAAARKAWAVLAYTVADDKGTGDSLDDAAKEELKALCDAADFGRMSVAAQVDFKHTRGVFRSVLTEAPPKTRGFESIPADSHPLWRAIKARLDRSKLRVLKDVADLNASRATVLKNFLRFGQHECPADRYVIFFYGHGYGPIGLFF